MKSFTLELISPTSSDRLEEVVSFVGRDQSGSFGILADAARRIAVLTFGLALVRLSDGSTEYLGLPGGLLYFVDNHLQISCESYIRDSNSEKITEILRQENSKKTKAKSQRSRKVSIDWMRKFSEDSLKSNGDQTHDTRQRRPKT